MAEIVSADPNRLEAHQKSPYRHLWWLVLSGIMGCIIYFAKNDEVFAAASLNLSMPKDAIIEKASQWAVKLGYNPEPTKSAPGASGQAVGERKPPDSMNPSIAPGAVRSVIEMGGPKRETPPEEPKPGRFDPKSPDPDTQRALKSITFSYDDDAKNFLEYELGVRRANELMVKEIPVWYWRVRMVRELQQEELRVWINPEGKLAGVDHDFENDKAMPSFTHKQAEEFARSFVEKETGNSLDGYQLIKDEESQKPKRKDHSFTFEDTKKEYNGAKMRVFIGIAGNQIESFNRYLHVPETFERKFETIRSYNMMLAKIAQIFMQLLMLVGVFAFGWAVMTGNMRWFPVIIIALIYSLVPSLDNINNFNELVDSYDPAVTYGSWVTNILIKTFIQIVPEAVSAIVLFGAAEALYRKMFPDHIAVEKIFTWEGLKSKAVTLGLFVGQLLFLIDLGWVVFYYLMGQKVGFWCPLGVENYQILSSYVPALSAMRVGVAASFMEEALYRVVGMGLMMRISGNFWVANLFQAAAWGFAHSTYPQQPFYARGVELTLGGLLDGWILRRYGLIACVASHYIFDTFLGVKPLFTSADPALKISALVACLPFIALLSFGHFGGKKKSERENASLDNEEHLLNRSLNKTIQTRELDETEPEETAINYVSIKPQKRLFLFVVTVLFGFLCFVAREPKLNSDAKVHIERGQAEVRAVEVLTRHGIQAPGYTIVSYLSAQTASEAEQYLYEKLGFNKTRDIVESSHSDGYCWRVRFFKPNTPEEYEVQLDGDGREIGMDIHLSEETKGAFLTKEAALAKARRDLESIYPYLTPYELESASEQKRPARTDWTFVFRAKKFDGPDAQFKINMVVLGDLVSGANWSWEVPDKWKFERSKRSLREELAVHVYSAGYLLLFVLGCIWIVGVLKARAVRVRPALWLALIYAIALIPSQLNSLPLFFAYYQTTTPVSNFVTNQMSSYVTSFLTAFCMSAIISAFAIASMRILFPQVRLSNYFLAVLRPHNKENQAIQRKMWVDGALSGYAYVALLELIAVARDFLSARMSPDVPESSLSGVSSLMNLQFPAFDGLFAGPIQGVQQVLFFAIGAGFYARYCRNAKFYFAFATLFAVGSCFGQKHYQDAIIGVIHSLAFYMVNWLFVARIARTNPVAYFTAGLSVVLFGRILSIVAHGLPVMLPTLAVSAVLLAGPAIVAAILSMRSESAAGQTPVLAEEPLESSIRQEAGEATDKTVDETPKDSQAEGSQTAEDEENRPMG